MKFRVPISAKYVATAVTGGILAGVSALLGTVGVYEVSASVQGWITMGAGLAGAAAGGFMKEEGVKFLDYAAERLNLKLVDFEGTD